MVSPKTLINKKSLLTPGFTLLEVLLVMGMLVGIASITVLFSMNFYHGEILDSERRTLISLLQTTRAESMQNKDELRHGVAIDPEEYRGYVLFNGNVFSVSAVETQVRIPRSKGFVFSSSTPKFILFNQLDGNANFQGQIRLINSHSGASTSITVNYEGAIY